MNGTSNEFVETPVTSPDRNHVDPHRSLSPPNTAEKFFLPLLPSSEISALALAESIRNSTNGTSTPTVTSKSATTLASEYVTCDGGDDDSEDENTLSSHEDDGDKENQVVPELYGGPIEEVDEDSEDDDDTEVIAVVKEQILQPSPPRSQPSTDEESDEGMARRGKQTKRQQHHNSNNNQQNSNTPPGVSATTENKPAPTAIAPPQTTTATKSAMSTDTTEQHFDVSQHAYEQVKNIWSFGKSLPVVKTFLGATEAVASKVLSVKGVKLTDVDREIKPQLSGLDNMLNPAIDKVVQIVMPFVQKAENAVKPVVQQFIVPRLLKPLGIVKDQSASNGDKLKVVVEGKDESSSNGGAPQGKKVISTTQVVTSASNIVQ